MGYNKELPKSLTSSGAELDPECGMTTSEIAEDAKGIFRKHNRASLDKRVAEPKEKESEKWNASNGSEDEEAPGILRRLEALTQSNGSTEKTNVAPLSAFEVHQKSMDAHAKKAGMQVDWRNTKIQGR